MFKNVSLAKLERLNLYLKLIVSVLLIPFMVMLCMLAYKSEKIFPFIM